MAKLLPLFHAGTCALTLVSWIVFVAGLSKITAVVNEVVDPAARRSVYGLSWWLVVYEFLALLVTTSLLVTCNHTRKMLATALLAINATIFIVAVHTNLNALDLLKIRHVRDIPWYFPCVVAGVILIAIANNVHLLLLGFSGDRSLALTGPSEEEEESAKQAQFHEMKRPVSLKVAC